MVSTKLYKAYTWWYCVQFLPADISFDAFDLILKFKVIDSRSQVKFICSFVLMHLVKHESFKCLLLLLSSGVFSGNASLRSIRNIGYYHHYHHQSLYFHQRNYKKKHPTVSQTHIQPITGKKWLSYTVENDCQQLLFSRDQQFVAEGERSQWVGWARLPYYLLLGYLVGWWLGLEACFFCLFQSRLSRLVRCRCTAIDLRGHGK